MYSQKPIPKPFQNKTEKPRLSPALPSAPIETKEKIPEKQTCCSPLAALLLLDFFTKQKDG